MAAENRDFGRFLTNWYNVHCKHTLFFEFLGLSNEFFIEEAWFWGVRVGFGGREGALASALIYVCISSLTSQHVYIGAGTSHRSARSLNCDNFGQEQYFLMR